MADTPRQVCTSSLHVELELIVDRLLSVLGSVDSTRTHVLENFAPDRELLRRIDSTSVTARDALLAITHLQLLNRKLLGNPMVTIADSAMEEQSRPTVRLPLGRR